MTHTHALAVIRATKAYDLAELRKTLAAGHEAKAAGKTFYHGESAHGDAVWPADDRTFVVGPLTAMVP